MIESKWIRSGCIAVAFLMVVRLIPRVLLRFTPLLGSCECALVPGAEKEPEGQFP